MKEIVRELRVTAEQVESWLQNGGRWPKRFTSHPNFDAGDWAIVCVEPAGDMWIIELGRVRNDDILIDAVRPHSKEWLEIIQQPTTFAHALECMLKQPVVFQDSSLEELYRINDGRLEVLCVVDVSDGRTIKEFKPMEFDGLIDGFITDTFTMRPDIDWETGREFKDLRKGSDE